MATLLICIKSGYDRSVYRENIFSLVTILIVCIYNDAQETYDMNNEYFVKDFRKSKRFTLLDLFEH